MIGEYGFSEGMSPGVRMRTALALILRIFTGTILLFPASPLHGEVIVPASRDTVRAPAVAGQFYPGSATALRDDVDSLLAAAKDHGLGDRIVAFVSPHAGYVYSGPTAALAWRQVKDRRYDAVIIIAPSHRDRFNGVSIMAEGGYATPLGIVPIESGIAARLLELDDDIRNTNLGHQFEHAVEVQLPFLQRALGPTPIVPLVICDHSWPVCRRLAEAIAAVAHGRSTLR